MKALLEPIRELGVFDELKKAVRSEGITDLDGCTDPVKTVIQAALMPEGVSVIVTEDDVAASQIAEEHRLFGRNVFHYPAKDIIFYQSDLNGNYLTSRRMAAIRALSEYKKGDSLVIVTTFGALMERLPELEVMTGHVRSIKKGDELDLEEISRFLTECGYERNVETEGPGQFAVRGGILDIFPLTDDNPVRIELWGDEVDSIRAFDAMSQRSIEPLEEVVVFPASDLIVDRDRLREGRERIEKEAGKRESDFQKAMKTKEASRIRIMVREFLEQLEEYGAAANLAGFAGYFFDRLCSLIDYFDRDTVFFLDEPARLLDRGAATEKEFAESVSHRLEGGYILPGQADLLFGAREVFAALSRRRCISFSAIAMRRDGYEPKALHGIQSRPVGSYNKRFELLVEDLKKYRKDKYRTVILCPSHTRAEHIAKDLAEYDIPAFYSRTADRVLSAGEVMTAYGSIRKGYVLPDIRMAVISETDIFGVKKTIRKKRVEYEGTKISSFTDLAVGDYVVHEAHGIGIYRGIEHIQIDGVIRDYVRIEYGGNSYVNVIASNLESLQKYASADTEKKIRLNKIGGTEWKKTRQRVRGAVEEVARKLVSLYAARSLDQGYEYGEDTVWQREFEEMFPFEETEDQLRAIREVKHDMQSRKIMDRLICGDVGFGKTEVALRAAFKAVQEGKQAAFLVPTTILAEQHYNTFVQRLASFPVKIDLLCRFRTPSQQKKTISDMKKGLVDIIVGTHRMLSKDIGFKDLGLLVIDEEQRFGVTHKERIKEMRKNVDVLTLTATPIPRTLHMSLTGIRDMSLLTEAPEDRRPIQTFVMEYSEEVVREAVSREIARGGQVYYVYNRINTIADVTAKIRSIVPEAEVEFAHGQMPEKELENVMLDFVNGKIDVLVSTTIVETGLDIPNVNTMIIHDSDRMGLSQLYQLRGRVGRSNRTSYAFLMYRRDRLLRETAEKRLAAIREFTDLGSGFKIAMRDLEIRGAGNVLGSEQSGHIEEVGYDLYCKMLDDAIKREKGEKRREDFNTYLDLDVDAYIPNTYVRNENIKLDLYKRIAAIADEGEAQDMREELSDRFGDVPVPASNLITIALLRTRAHELYVESMEADRRQVRIDIYARAQIDPLSIAPMLERFEGRMSFHSAGKPYFLYEIPKEDGRELTAIVEEILEKMRILVDAEESEVC